MGAVQFVLSVSIALILSTISPPATRAADTLELILLGQDENTIREMAIEASERKDDFSGIGGIISFDQQASKF